MSIIIEIKRGGSNQLINGAMAGALATWLGTILAPKGAQSAPMGPSVPSATVGPNVDWSMGDMDEVDAVVRAIGKAQEDGALNAMMDQLALDWSLGDAQAKRLRDLVRASMLKLESYLTTEGVL